MPEQIVVLERDQVDKTVSELIGYDWVVEDRSVVDEIDDSAWVEADMVAVRVALYQYSIIDVFLYLREDTEFVSLTEIDMPLVNLSLLEDERK